MGQIFQRNFFARLTFREKTNKKRAKNQKMLIHQHIKCRKEIARYTFTIVCNCFYENLWAFFFVAASRFTTREINTMLKLSSINISLKMNINWWVNSSLDFLFHLFALLFIACYTLIHSDISLNANWHSKRFTDRPFHRSTQWNTALIFLPPFGSNNQLPFES